MDAAAAEGSRARRAVVAHLQRRALPTTLATVYPHLPARVHRSVTAAGHRSLGREQPLQACQDYRGTGRRSFCLGPFLFVEPIVVNKNPAQLPRHLGSLGKVTDSKPEGACERVMTPDTVARLERGEQLKEGTVAAIRGALEAAGAGSRTATSRG
jgi:hypothetical protein